MALTINSNLISLYNQVNINRLYSDLSESVERLTTGLRINSVDDDPAGFYVSEFMRSEMAGNEQGIRNAQEGVALLQTAESGLAVIDEKLTRMKELAEQASTGTYTSSERLTMQSEFELMASEIDRIAAETDYNGTNLLDGTISGSTLRTTSGGWHEPDSGVLIHFGTTARRAEDYYYLTINAADTSSLFNNTNIAISTQAAAQTALEEVNTAIIEKDNLRSWVGSLQNRLEGTITNLENKNASLDYAESKISDADMADELTDYITTSVVLQSAIAIQAQANLFPQMVLGLLEF